MTHILFNRCVDVSLRFDTLFRFSKEYKKQNETLKVLHSFTNEVICKRRSELMTKTGKPKMEDEHEDIGIRKKELFLDVLLKSTIDGQPLSDLDIREEVDAIMFAVGKSKNSNKQMNRM